MPTRERFGCPEKDSRYVGLVCRAKERANDLALAGGLLGFLGQEDGLDVRQHTTLGDGDTGQELVQLLVVTDGQLEVTGDDSGLLVVSGGVACQLENLSGQVLEDGGQVHGGTGTDALGVVSFPQETVDTSDGELKSGPGRAGLGLALDFSAFATSRHDDLGCVCLSKLTNEWEIM